MDLRTETVSDLPTLTYLSMDPLTSTVGSSQVLAYVERLALRGVDVDLVTFEHRVDLDLWERLARIGVRWRPQDFGRHGSAGGLGRVMRARQSIMGAAMVHARSDMAAGAVALAGIDRWVWDVRSFWVDQKIASGVIRAGSMQERIMRRVEHRAAIRCSAAIALTESAIVELDRRYNYVVSPKATVITTCADLDRFQASTMPPMPLRVLLSGTLNRYYDLQSMLDLVAELRRRRPVEFIVASPGETGWEAELSTVEAVRVSATPDEMKDLVASCHLGLSVCRDDAGVSLLAAMPTKIGEFLAAGRPVVVNPGLVDATTLLVQERCGVTYGQTPSCGLDEVVDRLEALLADPVTPERCRSLAESHFDLDAGVDRLIGVYRSIGE